METNNETQPPVVPSEPKVKTSYGTLIALLLIVGIIVLGALHFLKERVEESPRSSDQVEALTEQGTSTEPAAIEQDLNAGSPDQFDEDLDKAFTELDAAFEAEAQ